MLSKARLFIKKAAKKHNGKYQYHDDAYIDNTSPTEIACPSHGVFQQTPKNHLRGSGCPKCANKNRGVNKAKKTISFIKESNIVHNNYYNYKNIKYINNHTNVDIICPKHGVFQQTPAVHVRGSGCKQCSRRRMLANNSAKRLAAMDNIIKRAKNVHGEDYSYSGLNGSPIKEIVKISCAEHGPFSQRMHNHLAGNRCPRCTSKVSKSELELLDFIKTLTSETVIHGDRTILNGKEIDVYIPSLKIGFEMNGIWFHSMKFKADKFSHRDKTKLAESKGVRLIHIRTDQWKEKKEIAKSLIRHACNSTPNRIGARKLKWINLNVSDYRDFLNNNHMQGYRYAKVRRGLVLNDEIIALYGYGKDELIRYCVKNNWAVAGGLGKVISDIGEEFYSYCERDIFNANGYIASGFTVEKDLIPWYMYVGPSDKRYSRQFLSKGKQEKRLAVFDKGKTEVENCIDNGIFQYWGVGNMRLKFIPKKA